VPEHMRMRFDLKIGRLHGPLDHSQKTPSSVTMARGAGAWPRGLRLAALRRRQARIEAGG
jgi:hypothetical protein